MFSVFGSGFLGENATWESWEDRGRIVGASWERRGVGRAGKRMGSFGVSVTSSWRGSAYEKTVLRSLGGAQVYKFTQDAASERAE